VHGHDLSGGYPWLIHKLIYRHTNSGNFHVRGYKEHGSVNTPMELAIQNQIDRFNLVIDVIDRLPLLGEKGAAVRKLMQEKISQAVSYAHQEGDDQEELSEWRWPYDL
jgi:xylulose-5-phosphate/fructose-6-phosphate phosphoketolase